MWYSCQVERGLMVDLGSGPVQTELGFVAYMIARALDEHPDSEELQARPNTD